MTSPDRLPTSPPVLPGEVKHAVFLVDFGNCYPNIEDVSASQMTHDILEVLGVVLQRYPAMDRCDIRVYGGWRTEGSLTAYASRVSALLGAAFDFPISVGGRLLHGEAILATSLLGYPAVVFEETHRSRSGLPHVRLASGQPVGCVEHPSDCPVMNLRRFTRSAGVQCTVVNCPVLSGTAFRTSEQKMVDNHIGCDLQEVADEYVAAVAVVISGDTDLLPPIVRAALRRPGAIVCASIEEELPDYFAAMLERVGVPVLAQTGENHADD
jgi:hypothetical protein